MILISIRELSDSINVNLICSASSYWQVGKDIVKQFQDAIGRSGHQIEISALVQLTTQCTFYTY